MPMTKKEQEAWILKNTLLGQQGLRLIWCTNWRETTLYNKPFTFGRKRAMERFARHINRLGYGEGTARIIEYFPYNAN